MRQLEHGNWYVYHDVRYGVTIGKYKMANLKNGEVGNHNNQVITFSIFCILDLLSSLLIH